MNSILFVDDDKNLLNLYQQEFQEDGYEVCTANNGYSAIKSLDGRFPDLVVLDIHMPGMDGIELLGKLLSKNRSLPVVINTAFSSYKDNFMCWAADAYVVKSGDLSELKAAIFRVLTEHGALQNNDSRTTEANRRDGSN